MTTPAPPTVPGVPGVATVSGVGERPAPGAQVGMRLRHARLVAGLTLLQLARQAACSESMVSKIERNLVTPSLATLHRLATVLGTNISQLTVDAAPSGGPVMRQGERPVLSGGGIALERLTLPSRGGLLQANIHIVAVGESSDGLIEHLGEEVGYVLEGELELTLGEQRYTIIAGDSFVFRSDVPHGYRNIGLCIARILWVNTPVTF